MDNGILKIVIPKGYEEKEFIYEAKGAGFKSMAFNKVNFFQY